MLTQFSLFFCRLSLLLVLFFSFPVGNAFAVSSLPTTKMDNISVVSSGDGTGFQISADVADDSDIDIVRCYFRFTSSASYAFVKMTTGGGSSFTGLLPASADNADQLEYVILAVNKEGQVVVSRECSVNISTLPERSVSCEGRLSVYTEAAEGNIVASDYLCSCSVVLSETDLAENYGVLAGLYSADQLEGSLVSGYFGSFQLQGDGSVIPKKGYAVALDEETLNTLQKRSGAKSSTLVDLNGDNWTGEFYCTYDDQAEKTNVVEITASITQNASNVVVVTTSLDGLGHRLAGQIYSGNHLLIYDDYDGEDWSTHWVPAEALYVQLADYVVEESDSSGTPLNVIELSRTSADGNRPILPFLPLLLSHSHS